MRLVILCAATLLCASVPAWGGWGGLINECPPDEQPRDCIDRLQKTANRALNAVYRELLRDADKAAQLKTAERAWIKWRDEQCYYETMDPVGPPGSAAGDFVASCETELTRAQTKRLRDILDCPDNPRQAACHDK